MEKIGFLALGVLFPFVANFGTVVTERTKARADGAVKLGAKGLPLFGDAPREQSLHLHVDVLRQVAFEPLDVDAIRGRPHARGAGKQKKTDDGRPASAKTQIAPPRFRLGILSRCRFEKSLRLIVAGWTSRKCFFLLSSVPSPVAVSPTRVRKKSSPG